MFNKLTEINKRPKAFEYYTASDLWTDPHTSKQMLKYHLNTEIDVSSRNGKFIDRSVKWMHSYFKLGRESSVADFGCGPGLYASRLAALRAQVTGIDFSESSLAYARQYASDNGMDIDYIRQNYLDFETDLRFDLIIMIMCDFCALSPNQRGVLLQKFRQLLKDDGKVVLDVYSLNAFNKKKEDASYAENQLDGFWSPDRYFGFLNTFKYEEEKVVLDKYTVIEADGEKVIYNWLQHFSPEALAKEFKDNGFTVDIFLGDVAGSDFDSAGDEFAIVGSKA